MRRRRRTGGEAGSGQRPGSAGGPSCWRAEDRRRGLDCCKVGGEEEGEEGSSHCGASLPLPFSPWTAVNCDLGRLFSLARKMYKGLLLELFFYSLVGNALFMLVVL
uniref:Uncharacterized protein n=1 Tax=Setaria italica TaxID=4555 RepID=K3ZKG0_SETIT